MIDIPLVRCKTGGEEWDQWYELERFGQMNLKPDARLGRIHLRCKIGPVMRGHDASSRLFAIADRDEDDRGDEEMQYEDMEPNFLRVTLHQVGVSVKQIGGGGKGGGGMHPWLYAVADRLDR